VCVQERSQICMHTLIVHTSDGAWKPTFAHSWPQVIAILEGQFAQTSCSVQDFAFALSVSTDCCHLCLRWRVHWAGQGGRAYNPDNNSTISNCRMKVAVGRQSSSLTSFANIPLEQFKLLQQGSATETNRIHHLF
jgi:hypothetical protein